MDETLWRVLKMNGRNRESVRFDGYCFVPGDGLWRNGQPIALPPRAVAVLTALLDDPGGLVTKQQLLDAAWPGTYVTESSLLEAIGLVRDALGDDRRHPRYVQTVHRRGYRFIAPVTPGEFVAPNKAVGAECSPPTTTAISPAARADFSPADTPFFSGPEWRPIVTACVTYALTTICASVVFAMFGQAPAQRPVGRFSISLPADAAIDPVRGSVAVSPDGSRVVYVARGPDGSQLFLRAIESDEPAAIPHTDDASDPFFSPDGEWIGFFARGSLQKIRSDGSDLAVLTAARSGAGAVWAADDTIVFGGGPGSGLARVSALSDPAAAGHQRSIAVSEPVVLAAPAAGSRDVRLGWPDVLPANRGVLFTSMTLAGSDVGVLDLRTGARKVLATQAAFARYSPTGHVIYERGGRLEAARFSLDTLTTTSQPQPVVAGVPGADFLAGPRFAFSETGALVYVRAAPSGEPAVWQHDLVAADPWLATTGGEAIGPAWRPNGLEIAFAYSKAGPFNLFLKPLNGGGAEPIVTGPWNQLPTSWSPDARTLAFTEFQPLTGADIWVIDVRTRQRRPVVRTLFDEMWARFSPDGRWIAYMSNETGRWEVYVRAAAEDGARVRVSTQGGVWPCWSVDGRTLYFSAGGVTVGSAISTTPALSAAPPDAVRGSNAMVLAGIATAPDRNLVRQAAASPGPAELRIVLDWFRELTFPYRPS